MATERRSPDQDHSLSPDRSVDDLVPVDRQLLLVDGRRSNARSAGIQAFKAPARSARARVHDRLYILLELCGQSAISPSLYSQVIEAMRDAYYQSTTSVTAGLRLAIEVANRHLLQVRPVRAEADWIQGAVTAVAVRSDNLFLAQAGRALAYIGHDSVLDRVSPGGSVIALGAEESSDIGFHSLQVEVGDVVLLSEASLTERASDASIGRAILGEGLDEALDNLERLADNNFAALLIAFRRAAEAIEDEPESSSPSGVLGRSFETPSAPADGAAVPKSLASPAAVPQTAASVWATARRAIAIVPSSMGRAGWILFTRLLPEEDDRQPPPPTWLLAGLAILVPVVIAVLVASVYVQRGQSARFSELISEASREVDRARASSTDETQMRQHWQAALDLLSEADSVHPGNSAVRDLRAQARDQLDQMDAITRLQLTPLRTFPADFIPRAVVYRDQYIFTLAGGAKAAIYYDRLNSSGDGLESSGTDPLIFPGQKIGEQIVGDILDMFWRPESQSSKSGILLAVDNAGNVILYSPGGKLSIAPLPGRELWKSPRAIMGYAGNLYILDQGNNQIWRYLAHGDTFPNPPEKVFADQPPDLSRMIDLVTDANGNLYMLSSSQIAKYFGAQSVDFNLVDLQQPLARPVALDVGSGRPTLYVADPGLNRIVHLNHTGAFLGQFKPPGDEFSDLRGMAVDETSGRIFVVTGRQLILATIP